MGSSRGPGLALPSASRTGPSGPTLASSATPVPVSTLVPGTGDCPPGPRTCLFSDLAASTLAVPWVHSVPWLQGPCSSCSEAAIFCAQSPPVAPGRPAPSAPTPFSLGLSPSSHAGPALPQPLGRHRAPCPAPAPLRLGADPAHTQTPPWPAFTTVGPHPMLLVLLTPVSTMMTRDLPVPPCRRPLFPTHTGPRGRGLPAVQRRVPGPGNPARLRSCRIP